jgi:hypothetical protein
MRIGKLWLAMAGAFAALFVTPASAVIIRAELSGINYESGNIYGGLALTSRNFSEIGPAGRFLFNGTNTSNGSAFSALTFCVDIFRAVDGGDFTISPLSSIVSNLQKQQQLAALVTNAAGAINRATTLGARNFTAAALQLAIWEVIYEGGIGNYSVADGDFFAFGTPDTNNFFVPLFGEANRYLTNISDGTWTGSVSRASILFSSTSQSQVFFNAAVPESATWAMMILGFGMIGGALRRRKQVVEATAV